MTAFCTWAFVVGAAWLGERLSSALRIQGPSPTFAAKGASSPERDFSQVLREQHLTGADCSAALSGMNEATLLSTLRELPSEFWRSNANASMLVRHAARSLASSREPARLLTELREMLPSPGVHPDRRRRLMTAAFAGVLEHGNFPRTDLLSILQGQSEPDALALLEVWLDFQTPTTPRHDLQIATEIMAGIAPEEGSRREDLLALMIVRLWAHRAPPLADAMLFAASYEHTRNEHLLSEGARILRMANPEELHRRLVQFSPVMSREAGQIAATTDIAAKDVIGMARAMSQSDAATFLESYLQTLTLYDPRGAAKFAGLISANEAAAPVAAKIVHSLVQINDLEGLREWIGTVPLPEQGKLWDRMFSSHYGGEDPSASAALYYLQHRPQELPPNFDALKSALGSLPYRDVVQYLSTADDAIRNHFNQLPANVVEGEIRRLRTENPDGIAAFLETLPPESRSSMAEHAFAAWWGSDPAMLRDLAGSSSDPALSATVRKLALKQDLSNLSLREVQSNLIRDLAASPGHATTFLDTTERILNLQSSSDYAIAFLGQLPPGELKDRATVSFAKKWADLDPVSAADWIAQLPASDMRDQAIGKITSSVRDDPERALANAAVIRDPKLRFESARTVLRLWRDRDPAIAEAAIAGAGFSPDDAAIFRGMIGGGKKGDR